MLLGHRCSPAITEYKVLRPGEAWVAKPAPVRGVYGGPVALSTESAVAYGSPVPLAVSPGAFLLFCLKRLVEFSTTQLFSAEQTPPREGHGGSRQSD